MSLVTPQNIYAARCLISEAIHGVLEDPKCGGEAVTPLISLTLSLKSGYVLSHGNWCEITLVVTAFDYLPFSSRSVDTASPTAAKVTQKELPSSCCRSCACDHQREQDQHLLGLLRVKQTISRVLQIDLDLDLLPVLKR